jgi:alpha/beta hydrolase family protein
MTGDIRPGRATAPDGTTIGWLSVGEGPGLVIVHGSMQSARSQLDLARLLAPHHEVHLMQRRGRRLSGPYPDSPPYTGVEVGDVATVLAATGARAVFAISSGALIALRAALAVAGLDRAIAFEPPLSVRGSVRLDQLDRFQTELAAGDLPGAMVTARLAAEMGPSFMARLPRSWLKAMTRRMLTSRKAQGSEDEPSVRELAQALRVDLAIVAENADRLDDFAAIRIPTVLMDGTRTRPYLRTAVAALAGVIPGARRVSLDGTNHGVTQNRDQWGRPGRIAPAILEALAGVPRP